MKQYIELLNDVLSNSVQKTDRTGTGTASVFGRMMRFDLAEGFPLITTKKVHFKSVVHELLWFLKGTDDTSYLNANGVSIWKAWETDLLNQEGESYPSIGPLYGVNWIHYKSPDGRDINQIDNVINEIRNRPDSRRLVVCAWNPATLPDSNLTPQENVKAGKGALAPCHAFFQFAVQDERLSCMLTQRSADLFLGVPFLSKNRFSSHTRNASHSTTFQALSPLIKLTNSTEALRTKYYPSSLYPLANAA